MNILNSHVYIDLINFTYYINFLTLCFQVKDICDDLDVRSLCHKILQNVSTLLRADRGSLFLVQGCKTQTLATTNRTNCTLPGRK